MPVVEHKQQFFFLRMCVCRNSIAEKLAHSIAWLQKRKNLCAFHLDRLFWWYFFFIFLHLFLAKTSSLAFMWARMFGESYRCGDLKKTAGFHRSRNKLYNILYLFWQVWFLKLCISHTSKKRTICTACTKITVWLYGYDGKRARGIKEKQTLPSFMIFALASPLSTRWYISDDINNGKIIKRLENRIPRSKNLYIQSM